MLFESERLSFRKPASKDFERFWAMLNDPSAKEFTGGVTRLGYEERLALFMEECGIDFSLRGAEFAVVKKGSSLYLGYCGFRESEALGAPEFLFGYCRDSWGKGFATEAARAVLKHLFRAYPHPAYLATVDPRNTASKRVMEKAGFTRTHLCPNMKIEPAEIYQLKERDFSQRY